MIYFESTRRLHLLQSQTWSGFTTSSFTTARDRSNMFGWSLPPHFGVHAVPPECRRGKEFQPADAHGHESPKQREQKKRKMSQFCHRWVTSVSGRDRKTPNDNSWTFVTGKSQKRNFPEERSCTGGGGGGVSVLQELLPLQPLVDVWGAKKWVHFIMLESDPKQHSPSVKLWHCRPDQKPLAAPGWTVLAEIFLSACCHSSPPVRLSSRWPFDPLLPPPIGSHVAFVCKKQIILHRITI